MAHDATKVLLGTTTSSAKEISNFVADPDDFPAGVGVRLDTTGNLSLGTGNLVGISLGVSLDETDRVAVARDGESVPVQLTEGFEPLIGDHVYLSDTTGLAVDSGDDDAVVTNATYVSGPLDGIQMDSDTLIPVALIDMPGGL
jgi:hypothetical protein